MVGYREEEMMMIRPTRISTIGTLSLKLFFALCVCVGASTAAAGAVPTLEKARGTYAIEKSSHVAFSVAQIGGGGIKGEFRNFIGQFRIDAQEIGRSTIKFALYPDSVTTGEPRVENFLRSSAVFDSKKFDRITFASTSITQTGADIAEVEGQLTAKGITRVEHFKAKLVQLDRSRIGFNITGEVYRSRYKMDVGTPIYSNIVLFNLEIVGRRM